MDEQEQPDSRLAAIFLEATRLHEQALAACLDELGLETDLRDAATLARLRRALMHAERAAACAADAANAALDAERAMEARRALAINRLAALGLRSLIGSRSAS